MLRCFPQLAHVYTDSSTGRDRYIHFNKQTQIHTSTWTSLKIKSKHVQASSPTLTIKAAFCFEKLCIAASKFVWKPLAGIPGESGLTSYVWSSYVKLTQTQTWFNASRKVHCLCNVLCISPSLNALYSFSLSLAMCMCVFIQWLFLLLTGLCCLIASFLDF